MANRIQWRNANGTLDQSTKSSLNVTSGQGVSVVTGVAPAGAEVATLRVYPEQSSTAWKVKLDAAMLVEGGVPSWYWADRPANLLAALNPGFERGVDGWEGIGAAGHVEDGLEQCRKPFTRDDGHRPHQLRCRGPLAAVPGDPGSAVRRTNLQRLQDDRTMADPRRVVHEQWSDARVHIRRQHHQFRHRAGGQPVQRYRPVGSRGGEIRIYPIPSSADWNVRLDGAILIEGNASPGGVLLRQAGEPALDIGPELSFGTTGWDTQHATLSQTGAWHADGDTSAQLTGTVGAGDTSAVSPFVPIIAGRFYSARMDANVTSAVLAGWRVALEWWDDTTPISGGAYDVRGSLTPGTGAHTGLVTGKAPTGATRVRVVLRANASLGETSLPTSTTPCWSKAASRSPTTAPTPRLRLWTCPAASMTPAPRSR